MHLAFIMLLEDNEKLIYSHMALEKSACKFPRLQLDYTQLIFQSSQKSWLQVVLFKSSIVFFFPKNPNMEFSEFTVLGVGNSVE